TRDELRSLAGTLNEMLDRLEQAALRRSRFVSDASHELKSPLAAMRTMVDVAAREGADPELVGDLREEIDRMNGLVQDLLFLARHDEARPLERSTEVDLDHVALRAARSLPSDVEIDTTAVEPVRIMGDPDRLEQLVRNLVENAARHAVDRIWITTAEAGHRATVSVRDDGPGVPAADAERIFDRFVRLDESRTRDTGGTGLGLSVARAIAHDHGGELVLADGS
ncbi:MAG: HAMP domain-containing histidine kinase, partial [Actinobacteria bacterium]|nr:HAMP domain-containing histidine kinase [Actinomycetota bacterium]NIU68403.1 HAMP domain-containing histidine kinase [Actinomycetota bacterium]